MPHAVPAGPSADRNLLFGVLALQADLLDAPRFAEACTAWSARKDTPLASLLVERGWLTPEDRESVEKLLERKLKKHAGDVRASLAEVLSGPVRETLDGLPDPVVRQTLGAVRQAEEGVHERATVHYEPAGRERYTLTRLHARGGIGQVWVARDGDLGREVALKELLSEGNDNPAVVARFLEEAQITGQLQHPNIVPVYELARPADKKAGPFYTMRFVRGRTLAAAVKGYHARRREGKAGPLELRELLGQFVAVCNAVAYAHSRGVLHRDLKPGNVVLGDFGEVIVLDWGLAKLKGSAEAPASLLPVSVGKESSRDATVQGQALGTPSYMPPEQAEGRQDRVDERSDVYGLGAVLYEILTGEPPFDGPDTLAVLAQVVADEPAPPRRLVPETPRALEAVALRALVKRPEGRYASAGDLAAEVQRWLGDEPVTAYREPLAVRAGRWRRRHRALVASAAAAAVVAVSLLGTGLFLWQRERDRQIARAEAALVQAEELRAAARWAEARAALQRADDLLGGAGPPSLRGRLQDLSGELELVDRLDAVRQLRAVRQLSSARAETDRQYEAAFRAAGLGGPGDEPAEVGRRVATSGVREQLVAALDDWAVVAPKERREWALQVARVADPDALRDRLRDPAAWADVPALARVAAEAAPEAVPPELAAAVGLRLGASTAGEQLLRSAQLLRPGDYWLNAALARTSFGLGRLKDGEAYSRAALAARPDSAAPRANIAYALILEDSEEDPEPYLRKALELDPTAPGIYINLGEVVLRRGRPEEALALARKAVEIAPDTQMPLGNLSEALLALGRYAEAREAAGRALALPHPLAPDARKELEATRGQAERGERLSAALGRELGTAGPPGGVALAEACTARKHFAAAARAYAGALAADPGLAGEAEHGLKAARAAALAAAGRGEDATTFQNRLRFRGLARRRLSAEVDRLKRQAGGDAREKVAAGRRLRQLLADDDLAGVRDAERTKQLPAAERKSWDAFWSEVRALADAADPAGRPVVLRAADARVHGSTLRLEKGQDGNLGYWFDAKEYAEWAVKGVRPGRYRVSLIFSCGGNSGGDYVVAVGDQKCRGTSRDTGGWHAYTAVDVGTVALPGGDVTVSVRPEGVVRTALMNLRSVTLTPTPEP